MEYKITQEELQKILDYLQQKPYHEVFELINIIIKIANKSEDDIA
jgi:hypothetical protein